VHILEICLTTKDRPRSSRPRIVNAHHGREEKTIIFTNREIFFFSFTDWCTQTALPATDGLSLPVCVEPGPSEWYSPVAGLHPRPAPADGLVQYFAAPQRATNPQSPPLNPHPHPHPRRPRMRTRT
jgi:hypothetical protein